MSKIVETRLKSQHKIVENWPAALSPQTPKLAGGPAAPMSQTEPAGRPSQNTKIRPAGPQHQLPKIVENSLKLELSEYDKIVTIPCIR